MNMKKEDFVHIVFISDENYVMPTVVAITSLYMNKAENTNYSVHILASDISNESRVMFQNLQKDTLQIEILDQDHSSLYDECGIKDLHVSTAALYKFNIANLFPEYSKIIYLDGDILVKKDLSELYNTDITNVYAAVIKDYKPMLYNPPQVKKLHIDHSAYFNSGVMLLNLEKLRADDLFHKLLQYRLNGINYFMDQDALNVVFQEKVLYISFLNNVMSSVMGYFKTEDILSYYELPAEMRKEDIYEKSTIVHLCTKYKPWVYINVPFADEWIYYYNCSPYTNTLLRKKLDPQSQSKVFAEIGYRMTPQLWNISTEVIVSLTSYPARIKCVSSVIDSIFKQTVKVDKVLLWLAEEQFPDKEKNLPIDLLDQRKYGLEIHWCDDLKPHKKYYYTMKEFPESIVITIDDDVYYCKELVETLLTSYVHYPFAVSAMRAHLITFSDNGEIESYSNWKREFAEVGIPSMALCATGVGGVLYPPGIMHEELFNKERIEKLCICADDLWLKVMQILAYCPVVVAAKPKKLIYLEDSQNEALWKLNDISGGNDKQLLSILQFYNFYFGQHDTIIQRLRLSSLNLCKGKNKRQKTDCLEIQKELENTKKEIRAIHCSWTYRIGRFITFLPRMIRKHIRKYFLVKF